MKKIIYAILILALAGIIFYAFTWYTKKGTVVNTPEITPEVEYISYKNSEYGPEFSYPKSWGEVTLQAGNRFCPEEDTYRTQDSLVIFDREFSFPEIELPGSISMIRTGVRTYEFDPENPNVCGGAFLLELSKKETDPRTISSVKLEPVALKSGLSGIYNNEASRLNTESRIQYTFFVRKTSTVYVIQPYFSFIPYFGSPELEEMEKYFDGDMAKYLAEGKTAGNIRKHIDEFKKMAESLKLTAE